MRVGISAKVSGVEKLRYLRLWDNSIVIANEVFANSIPIRCNYRGLLCFFDKCLSKAWKTIFPIGSLPFYCDYSHTLTLLVLKRNFIDSFLVIREILQTLTFLLASPLYYERSCFSCSMIISIFQSKLCLKFEVRCIV